MSFFSLDKEYAGWPLERIARHVLYWGLWLTFYCILNASYQGSGYLQWLWLELMFMTVKLPYAYFVAYYLFPKLLPQKKYTTLFFSMLLFAFVGVWFMVLLLSNFPDIALGQPTEFFAVKTFFRALDLVYIASLVVVIKMIQRFMRQERISARLREEKVGSELQILKNQLQPHLLLNTLNNIYGLVLSDDKKAGGAVLKLSNIISYMLYECNVDYVELEKEVSLLRNYMELEKIRYGDRLDVSFDIQGSISGKYIAPLLLMPFVENAFKHGAAQSEGPSWIRISLETEADEIFFMVENSLSGIPSGGTPELKSGIGLENVRKRLILLYPERHWLQIKEDDTYWISLKIKL